MTEPTNDAGNAAAGTGNAAPATGGQPDYKALYEQTLQQLNAKTSEAKTNFDRFAGLQGKYQSEQQKWQDTFGTLTTVQEQLQALQGEKVVLETNYKTEQEKAEEAAAELEITKAALERTNTVVSKFPRLVPFLDGDLLPDGVGEELIQKLTAFESKLDLTAAQKVADVTKGASPNNPPAPAGKPSPDSLMQQAFTAARKGDTAEYNRLYDEYVKATQTK